MKCHDYGMKVISYLCELLKSEESGSVIAEGFKVLLEDSSILNKENHSIIKPFYKQKLFTIITPQLLKESHNSVNHLVAMANLIQGTPQQVLLPQLPQVKQKKKRKIIIF